MHAIERGDRVVISTATIALQDQLLKKDVPALIGAAENVRRESPEAPLARLRDLKVALLKGRANYLCLRRWFLAQRDEAATPAQAQLYAKIIAWLQQTETGDSAELHLSPDQRMQWSRLSAEEGACVPSQCVFHRRNQCFLFRARHQAEASHIVIVNHSLLLSDLITGRSALPTFKQLVVDEAHHLEEEATHQVGYALSRGQSKALIERIISEVEPIGLAGAIGLTYRAVTSGSGARPKAASKEMLPHVQEADDLGKRCVAGIERIFSSLADFVTRYDQGTGGYDRQLRVTGAVRRDPGWSQIEVEWDDLLQPMSQLVDVLRTFSRTVEGLSEDDLATRSEILTEFELLEREVDALRTRLTELLSQPASEMIYWLTRHQTTGDVSGHAAPLFVGSVLNEQLFRRCDSVTLTSATLTTDGSFEYVKDRLGLEYADEVRVPSPFDYQRAALLAIADDIPEPGEPGYQKRLQEAVTQVCLASQGRAMVLFTSHSALQTTYRAIKRPLEQQGILVLGQRIDGSPRQLIDRLKAHPRTIVLGTNSFWEGVDIVGDALSLLVITKLPFPVPSDPVFAARSELFDDPFNHYAVPQAILRFKQGFGRLIRSADDRGVCVVLDRRIATRRYGDAFVNSLPECRVEIAKAGDVATFVGDFLGIAGANVGVSVGRLTGGSLGG
jgi:DNA polymerase-3 subunit epsilon/ATP-dependent DNA helicase DinG